MKNEMRPTYKVIEPLLISGAFIVAAALCEKAGFTFGMAVNGLAAAGWFVIFIVKILTWNEWPE